MPKVEHSCERCGEIFMDYAVYNRRFCSRQCSNQSTWKERERTIRRPEGYEGRLWRRIYYHVCQECGDLFIARTTKRTYCSKECTAVAFRNRDISICETCGKEIEHYPHEPRRFCSRQCAGQRLVCEPTLVEFVCEQCGDTFHDLPSRDRTFCSIDCRASWQRENPPTHKLPIMYGEDNPNWKGGYGNHYYGPNWPMQRRKARKRDSYQCQVCGISEMNLNRQLDVHHIKPFRDFNNDWQQANRLINLISLCKTCHKNVEVGNDIIQPRLF